MKELSTHNCDELTVSIFSFFSQLECCFSTKFQTNVSRQGRRSSKNIRIVQHSRSAYRCCCFCPNCRIQGASEGSAFKLLPTFNICSNAFGLLDAEQKRFNQKRGQVRASLPDVYFLAVERFCVLKHHGSFTSCKAFFYPFFHNYSNIFGKKQKSNTKRSLIFFVSFVR